MPPFLSIPLVSSMKNDTIESHHEATGPRTLFILSYFLILSLYASSYQGFQQAIDVDVSHFAALNGLSYGRPLGDWMGPSSVTRALVLAGAKNIQ